jgi:hypothetical protein
MANNTDLIAQADVLGPTALVAAASSLAPDALRGKPNDALIVLMAPRAGPRPDAVDAYARRHQGQGHAGR